MQKFSFRIVVAMAIAVTAYVFSGCKDSMIMLDISYPAAFVVNGQTGDIDVINLNNDTHEDHISLNGATFPHHIYLNPSKTKFAVAITAMDLSGGHGGHGVPASGLKVLVIDATTGMIEKEISLPKVAHNATFDPSGTELWLGQQDNAMASQILVYKTSDWTLKNTINVGLGLSEVTFSQDGSMVFAANTMEGTVTVIDPVTKMVHATIPVGDDPVGAWPASNGNMYVDNETSQTVSEISVANMNVTATINLGFKPGYVAYNGINSELWVSNATNGQVHYYQLMGGTWMEMGTIATGADAHAIAFLSGGTKAMVTNQGAGTVSMIDVATHTKTNDIVVGLKPNGIAIKQ